MQSPGIEIYSFCTITNSNFSFLLMIATLHLLAMLICLNCWYISLIQQILAMNVTHSCWERGLFLLQPVLQMGILCKKYCELQSHLLIQKNVHDIQVRILFSKGFSETLPNNNHLEICIQVSTSKLQT